MKSIGTTVKMLSCKLTDAELQALGGDLAQAVQDLASEEARQVSLKAEMKARQTEIEARVQKLSLVVARREEYRDVKVNKILLDDGMVREVREDTGEIIAMRPIHDDERQLSMPPPASEKVTATITTQSTRPQIDLDETAGWRESGR